MRIAHLTGKDGNHGAEQKREEAQRQETGQKGTDAFLGEVAFIGTWTTCSDLRDSDFDQRIL